MSVAQPEHPTANRRGALRRQAAVGTVCQIESGQEGKGLVGLVWNISTSGVSMLLHAPVEAGSVVRGELRTIDGKGSLPVTLRAVHVNRIQTGDYFLGAQFQRPCAPEELRPFVATA